MPAQPGDTVRVHYKGTLEDGTEFDSSSGREPLEFQVGGGEVLPGFESAIQGMEPGEEKSITVPADEAYGPRNDEMVLRLSREQIPPHIDPKEGDQLQLQTPEGQPVPVRVAAVEDGNVVLDANHPLAGQDLNFEIKLEEIV